MNEHLQALLDKAHAAETSEEPWSSLRRFLRGVLELQLADIGLAEVLNAPQDAHVRTSQMKAPRVRVVRHASDLGSWEV